MNIEKSISNGARKMNKIIGIAVMVLAALVARETTAALIASESFSVGNGGDYVNSVNFNVAPNSTNLTGNTGFSTGNPWAIGTSLIQPRDYDSLTHTLVQGSTASGMAAVRPGGGGIGRQVSRELAAVPTGSTFYMSGLVSIHTLDAMDPNETIAMGLIGSIGASTFNVGSGLHLGMNTDSSGNVYLSAFAAGNTYHLGDALTVATALQTQMIVLRLDVDTSGANDTLTGWIAQAGETNLTQVLSVNNIDTGAAANLKTFVVQSEGGADAVTAGGGRLDEFRFGTTLNDVAAVPEPATISMLGIGTLLVLLTRRFTR